MAAHDMKKSAAGFVLKTGVLALLAWSTLPAAVTFNYFGAGFSGNLVVADDVGLGGGAGGHLRIGFDLDRVGSFQIYPNLEMWVGTERYLPEWQAADYYDFVVAEISINADGRYYFPLPASLKLAPYIGLGIPLVITVWSWDVSDPREDDNDTKVGLGFDFLAGFDFPLGRALGFFEIKGKVGAEYECVKFGFGVSLPINK